MSDLIVACTRIGERTPFDTVKTLRNAVERNLDLPHTMVCLTDQPERCTGVAFVDIKALGLIGWWNRMALFEPQWRGWSKVIYLGSDVAVVGNIAALADVPGEFAICHGSRPELRYNSSVMVLGGNMGNFVWNAFERRRDLLLMLHARGGPSSCIAELYPSAPLLQRILPPGFFEQSLRL